VELLERLLPAPPAQVLDVGGGPGTYAAPLARRGYRVHVVDPVPLHVEQARQAAGADPAASFTAALGDARQLAEAGESQDAVLLFGPLYHLTGTAHRQRALAEARRVLAPVAACWRWRCAGSPRCSTGCIRIGWTIRTSGRSWTRTWWMGSIATPIRSAGRSSSPPPTRPEPARLSFVADILGSAWSL
jgi:SAM-dependent methyltransferase